MAAARHRVEQRVDDEAEDDDQSDGVGYTTVDRGVQRSENEMIVKKLFIVSPT